ncbi:MAG: hypothetical protein ACR65R_16570 [Methylomicrobium sp.]
MIIFLKDIPINAKKSEILAFIEPVFNDCFLGKPTSQLSIQDIEFLSIQDVTLNKLEKHALIKVSPREVARRMTKRMNGALFKNKPIMAREYVNRSSMNDRRLSATNVSTEFLDRRVADRRRVPLMNSWQKDPILVQSINI